VSDHLDEAARQQWMETIWPEIMTHTVSAGCPFFSGMKSVSPNRDRWAMPGPPKDNSHKSRTAASAKAT
jgi:hypothetical protein